MTIPLPMAQLRRSGEEFMAAMGTPPYSVASRLFGSVAIHQHADDLCSWWNTWKRRPSRDVDIVIVRNGFRMLDRFLKAHPRYHIYEESRLEVNAGRAILSDTLTHADVDLFQVPLRLNHDIDVAGSFRDGSTTLRLSELFLAETQYRAMKSKSIQDSILVLLHVSRLEPQAQEDFVIELADAFLGNWRLWQRFRINLKKSITPTKYWRSLGFQAASMECVMENVRKRVAEGPHCIGWKMRNAIATKWPRLTNLLIWDGNFEDRGD